MNKLSLERRESHILKTAAILLALLLAVLVVPMIMLGQYDVPCTDDYSFGTRAHHVYAASGSFLAAVKAAAEEARLSYSSWQGSFSAIFLMALQPAVFGERLYAFTAPIMLFALIGGTYCFCSVIFKDVFGAPCDAGYCAAALLLVLCTQLPLSPVQGFYWFNGAVYYTLFYGVALAALALAVRLFKRGGVVRAILLSLIAVFLGGGNYVTVLSLLIIAASAALLFALLRDRRVLRLIAPILALSVAAAISMTAPGNSVRQANYLTTPTAVEAVLLSFKYAVQLAVYWTRLPVLGVLLFLAVLTHRAAAVSRFSFRFPGLVTPWSFCLYAAMFCPPLYAMGNYGDARLLNIIFFAYLLLFALNIFYWQGYFARLRREKHHESTSGKASYVRLLALPAVAALICAFGFLSAVRAGQPLTSVNALSSLRSGEAAAYYACAEARFEILNDPAVLDAEIPAFSVRPVLLYYDDITADPVDWRNGAMQEYYGKSSVVAVPY